MRKGERQSNRQIAIRLLFILYCGVMLWLLFGQRMEGIKISICLGFSGENLNLVPFETVRLYWRLLQRGATEELLRHAMINLAGNVVVFIPLGWFLPCIWPKMRGFFKTVLTAAVSVCLVEICQYITNLGSCDIDDLLLNLVGVILGYVIWKIFKGK